MGNLRGVTILLLDPVFVAMSNIRLPTNFQLNIFIFEARVTLQTLLQSLKQNANKSTRLGNNPNQPSFTGDLALHDGVRHSFKVRIVLL